MQAQQFFREVAQAINTLTRLAHGSQLFSRLGDPAADPYRSLFALQQSLSRSSGINSGVVVDYVPGINAYRIQPDSGGPLLLCTRAGTGSPLPIGAADTSLLLPRTPVIYTTLPDQTWGTILNALPMMVTDLQNWRQDYVVAGSRVGLAADAAHQSPFMLGPSKSGAGLRNWGARTPVDNIGMDTLNWQTETGLNIHLDPYMIQMRVDEVTGIWAFYWDQLLRVAGYNLQQWAAGYEQELLDDEGELSQYTGWCAYLWEHLGLMSGPMDAFKTLSDEEVQLKSPHLHYREPKFPNAQPFHRTIDLRGYIGQGWKVQQRAPGSYDFLQYEESPDLTGLAEFQIMLDGHVTARSARGMSFWLRPIIPAVHRMRAPNDPTGDTPENYKPSGKFGKGKEHKVQSAPPTAGPDPVQVSAVNLVDLHAHTFNWKGCFPLHYHEKDFDYPEESSSRAGKNQANREFVALKKSQYLPDPPAVSVRVDDRQTVQIYQVTAGWEVFDNGSFAWRSGCGCEIRAAGGTLRISAPGDIHLDAGRHLVGWAGSDINFRARDSIDAVATRRDIRLKSEQNTQIIAANGGENYGLMLECRSKGVDYDFEKPGEKSRPVGIILRSMKSPIALVGKDIVNRAVDGNILIDANRAKGDVQVHARGLQHFITGSIVDYFGTEGQYNAVNIWSEAIAVIGTTTHVYGSLSTKGAVSVKGGVYVVEGHINTDAGNEKVVNLVGQNRERVLEFITSRDKIEHDARTEGTKRYETLIKERWYAEKRICSPKLLEIGTASLRTVEDYGTDGFKIYESHWANMARLGGGTPGTWEEKAVLFKDSEKTYPYPGKEKFEEPVYYTVDPMLVESGRAKDRGELYESPPPPIVKPTSLNSYPIVGGE